MAKIKFISRDGNGEEFFARYQAVSFLAVRNKELNNKGVTAQYMNNLLNRRTGKNWTRVQVLKYIHTAKVKGYLKKVADDYWIITEKAAVEYGTPVPQQQQLPESPKPAPQPEPEPPKIDRDRVFIVADPGAAQEFSSMGFFRHLAEMRPGSPVWCIYSDGSIERTAIGATLVPREKGGGDGDH